jgi:hypothetical protein
MAKKANKIIRTPATQPDNPKPKTGSPNDRVTRPKK